ncbi:MAG TPA: hypothetical protein VGG89_13260 [Candidatus Baltobacteraceae bacterium]
MYRLNALLVLLVAAGLAACASQPPARDDQPSTGAAATAAPTLEPIASPAPKKRRPDFARTVAFVTVPPTATPSPAASASATPSATPSATASPAARKHVVVPVRKPDAPPQIVDIEMNTNNVGSGDTLWGKVLTSSNVASVEVRIANFGVGLNKVGVGRFTLAYRLGAIPFFAHGTYPMHVIARNSRGDKAERTLQLTIH